MYTTFRRAVAVQIHLLVDSSGKDQDSGEGQGCTGAGRCQTLIGCFPRSCGTDQFRGLSFALSTTLTPTRRAQVWAGVFP